MGRTHSMFQVGLALAAVAGGVMATRSYVFVMWASVIPQVAALIISTQLIEPSVVSKINTNILAHLSQSLVEFRRNYRLRLLTVTSALKFGAGESGYLLRSAFLLPEIVFARTGWKR